jgi:hypothetical protein
VGPCQNFFTRPWNHRNVPKPGVLLKACHGCGCSTALSVLSPLDASCLLHALLRAILGQVAFASAFLLGKYTLPNRTVEWELGARATKTVCSEYGQLRCSIDVALGSSQCPGSDKTPQQSAGYIGRPEVPASVTA